MANGDNGHAVPAAPVVELRITLVDFDRRAIQLSGPLQDRFVCYALLEMAREQLIKMASRPEVSPIVRPGPLRLG